MNLKMISEICKLLNEGKKVRIYNNNYYNDYVYENNNVYKITEEGNKVKRGLDFFIITKFEVIEEPEYKAGDCCVMNLPNNQIIKIKGIDNYTGLYIYDEVPKRDNGCRNMTGCIKRHATLEDFQEAIRKLFNETGFLIYKKEQYNYKYKPQDDNVFCIKKATVFSTGKFKDVFDSKATCIDFLEHSKPYNPEEEPKKIEFEKIKDSYNINVCDIISLIKNQQKIISVLEKNKLMSE